LALNWAVDTGLDAPTLGAATIKAEATIDKLFDPVGDKLSNLASKAAKTITASLQRASWGVTAGEDAPTPGTDPHGNPGAGGLDAYAGGGTYFDQAIRGDAAATEFKVDESEEDTSKEDVGDGKRDKDSKTGDGDGNDPRSGISML
jgi:hypothetical protein